MIKIGDFSKLTQVPVKTLRFYDDLGLLKPAQVDSATGYRYYTAQELHRLNRILALKDLGLSLEQIGQLLDQQVGLDEMRQMLRSRREELDQQMREQREQMARVEARLALIEREGRQPVEEVSIKKTPTIRAACLRGVVPVYEAQRSLWRELEGLLYMQRVRPIEPCFTIYYDEEYKEQYVDLEVCYPTELTPGKYGRMVVRDVQGCDQTACMVHRGSWDSLHRAYNGLLEWLQINQYRIIGPNRDVYHYTGKGPTRRDDPTYITEIQVMVEKTD